MFFKIILTAILCGLFGAVFFYLLATFCEEVIESTYIADIIECVAILCAAIAAIALIIAIFYGFITVIKFIWS